MIVVAQESLTHTQGTLCNRSRITRMRWGPHRMESGTPPRSKSCQNIDMFLSLSAFESLQLLGSDFSYLQNGDTDNRSTDLSGFSWESEAHEWALCAKWDVGVKCRGRRSPCQVNSMCPALLHSQSELCSSGCTCVIKKKRDRMTTCENQGKASKGSRVIPSSERKSLQPTGKMPLTGGQCLDTG